MEARGFLLSSPFQVQPEVSLIDWGSNLASTSFGSITAQLLQPSGRNAVLESVNGLVATTKNGKAAFNGLSVSWHALIPFPSSSSTPILVEIDSITSARLLSGQSRRGKLSDSLHEQ